MPTCTACTNDTIHAYPQYVRHKVVGAKCHCLSVYSLQLCCEPIATLGDSPQVSLACAGIAPMVGRCLAVILDSIVVSIPACHAGDRGSIPRRGDNTFSVIRRFLVNGIIQRDEPPFPCNYAIYTQAVKLLSLLLLFDNNG